MKNSESSNQKTFKGAGYTIGAVVGLVAAIAVFAFTENIAVSIPVFAGLSIPLGMSIEQKLQGEANEKEPHVRKIMIALIGIGVLFLFAVIFITKII